MRSCSAQVRKKALAWTAVFLFVALTALVCWRVGVPMVRLASEPEQFRQWIEQQKLGGQAIYVGMVALQVLAAVIPGEPLEIAGGYAFGAIEGTLLCLLGGAVGSLVVIGLVRRFGLPVVEVFFSQEKLHTIRFLKSSPKRTLLFLVIFMVPGTPKDLLCYFAGLTDIPFPVLLLICTLGRLPAIVTSTIGGSALGSQQYLLAVVVFLLTLLLSGGGLLLYKKICHIHGRKP